MYAFMGTKTHVKCGTSFDLTESNKEKSKKTDTTEMENRLVHNFWA